MPRRWFELNEGTLGAAVVLSARLRATALWDLLLLFPLWSSYVISYLISSIIYVVQMLQNSLILRGCHMPSPKQATPLPQVWQLRASPQYPPGCTELLHARAVSPPAL